MGVCAVSNCNSSNNKRLKRNAVSNSNAVKFFRFPKDPKMVKIWVHRCGRKNKINPLTSSICSKHFTDDQYISNLRHELLQYSPKNAKKLKDDAVPSENLPSTYASIAQIKAETSIQPIRGLSKHNMESYESLVVKEIAEANMNCVTVNVLEQSDEMAVPNAEVQLLSVEIDNLKRKMKFVDLENLKLRKENHRLRVENNAINNIFTATQRKQLGRESTRIPWTHDDICNCLSIYASGPKAYRLLLKRGYPYPAVKTLKKWAAKLGTRSGLSPTNAEQIIESSDDAASTIDSESDISCRF